MYEDDIREKRECCGVKNFFLKIVFFVFLYCTPAWSLPSFEADVSVDITDKTVVDAKKKAMSKAMRDGLKEVVLGISTDESVVEINKLKDNQLEHFISGIMVLMEKTSDVRYIADLRVSVNGDILKAYLEENNLPIVIGEEKEVLVIPLFEDKQGKLDVWGDDNIWRQAFLNYHNLHRGNNNFQLIDKNLGNINMVKADRVYNMTDGECAALLDFNRVDALCVFKYSLKEEKVFVKNCSTHEVNEALLNGKSPREVIDVALDLFKGVKTINSGRTSVAAFGQIEAIYHYNRLVDWMSLKQILEKNRVVQDIKIISMANGKVHFNFQYGGVIEKLQGTLSANGYKMRNEGEYYVIY